MTLTILSLEDEADVRDALERDLEHFWDKIRLEVAEDVDDAWAVIDEIVEDGDELALVLSDHRLPGKSGVDFLVELMKDERFGATRLRGGPHVSGGCLKLSARTPTGGGIASYRACPSLAGGQRR